MLTGKVCILAGPIYSLSTELVSITFLSRSDILFFNQNSHSRYYKVGQIGNWIVYIESTDSIKLY